MVMTGLYLRLRVIYILLDKTSLRVIYMLGYKDEMNREIEKDNFTGLFPRRTS